VIDPSLLLVHVCGTIYHFISVTCELSLLEFCRLMKTHLFGWWSQRLVSYYWPAYTV